MVAWRRRRRGGDGGSAAATAARQQGGGESAAAALTTLQKYYHNREYIIKAVFYLCHSTKDLYRLSKSCLMTSAIFHKCYVLFCKTLKNVYLAWYILQKYYHNRETLLKLYSSCITVQKTYTKNKHYKSDTSSIVTKVLSLLTRQENSDISHGYRANPSDY